MFLELLVVLSSYRIYRVYSMIKYLKCCHFKSSIQKELIITTVSTNNF